MIYAVEVNIERTYESLLVYVEAESAEAAEGRLRRFVGSARAMPDYVVKVKADEQSVIARVQP